MNNISPTFCVQPWVGFYNQVNQGRCCCAYKSLSKETVSDYTKSEEIINLRRALLNGEKPDGCSSCWDLESKGLRSIRSIYNHMTSLNSDISEYSELDIENMELRASNLCNLSCRMCDTDNSSLLANEVNENTSLEEYYPEFNSHKILDEIDPARWQDLLKRTHHLKNLILTGGEPMIKKQFYELLDYLVIHDLSQKIDLQVTTNCTIYNQLMLDRMYKFKSVRIVMSLDGVDETAEYQRYGKKWNTIKNNVLKLILQPVECIAINATITAYNVLDMSKFADFIITILNKNKKIFLYVNFITGPQQIQIWNLNKDLKLRAINELREAAKKLSDYDMTPFSLDLTNAANDLESKIEEDNTKDFQKFIKFTQTMDKIRNQSFEETFNYKLY